jgi:hypothetical protein
LSATGQHESEQGDIAMELLLIYFFCKKIRERTVKFEYPSTPYIIAAVAIWLIGEVGGFLLGLKLFSSGLYGYLLAICGSTMGAFLVYQWVMRLPKRNIDYFDLRQTKKFLEEVAQDSKDSKESKKSKKDNPNASSQAKAEAGSETKPFLQGFHSQNTDAEPESKPESKPKSESFLQGFRSQNADAEPESKPKSESFLQGFRSRNADAEPESKPKSESFLQGFRSRNADTEPESKPESESFLQGFHSQNADAEPDTKTFFTDFRDKNVATVETERIAPPENPTARHSTSIRETAVTAMPESNPPASQSANFMPPAAENITSRLKPVNPELKFPDSELHPLERLISAEYGFQTVPDRLYSDYEWYDSFNYKYNNHEIRAALIALEKAMDANIDNGLPWLLYGRLYKEEYQNYDKALQFCLTGALRCNSFKVALLTEAAEILLLEKQDLINGFCFFCYAILAITEGSKAWGGPELAGAPIQERAFHIIRIYLSVFNFTDYRLYLERNVRFITRLDQPVIERVLTVFKGSPLTEETVKLIPQLFPLIIEKLQVLAWI